VGEGVSDRAKTVEAVKKTAELRSTVRLYVKEFVFDSRFGTKGEAWARYDTVYLGRVGEGDSEFRLDPIRSLPHELWIRRWNLVGEYKNPEKADEAAAEIDGETKVVPRNSRAEHTLKNYGVVKLAT